MTTSSTGSAGVGSGGVAVENGTAVGVGEMEVEAGTAVVGAAGAQALNRMKINARIIHPDRGLRRVALVG
ncbi:hypothetical protein [Anaerolinea thermolimosa]|uniref:hypothetical protein n=1 Tax=Anaerolinea thermolimosa TaxID=229919 RepID=UPI001F185DB3|nr:hypothetical protein [Anaerolinea thermolimosa]